MVEADGDEGGAVSARMKEGKEERRVEEESRDRREAKEQRELGAQKN